MKKSSLNRRQFLRQTTLGTAALAAASVAPRANAAASHSLFDGKTLAGWKAVPRLAVPQHLRDAKTPATELKTQVVAWYEADPERQKRLAHIGRWEVVDGAIVGGQEPPGSELGAYLLSEKKFSDFELDLEARPDWPADTGIMLRAHELGSIGFQVLVDHRPNGGIGGVFGNGIGSFLAAPFTVDGDVQPGFRVTNLRAGNRESNFPAPTMSHAATFADFEKVWRPNEWNHFRIRCLGRLPVLTTWINGLKICELDTAKIATPGYDTEAVFRRLGPAGHIGFEVHDVNLKSPLGQDRWAIGAVCRWQNISITEL